MPLRYRDNTNKLLAIESEIIIYCANQFIMRFMNKYKSMDQVREMIQVWSIPNSKLNKNIVFLF